MTAQSAQFDDFCSGDCTDDRSPGSLVPRVPPRVGYGFRVRMPFWLIPGDLLLMMLGDDFTQDAYQKLRSKLGFDRSIVTQYLIWLSAVLQGDFGSSYLNHE